MSGDSTTQLFANGSKTTPVYGFGASAYGIDAVKNRGRVAHVQFREQNSGFTPSEDYRSAKFLPGLWRDLDRNGCPYVMPGGIMMGLAGVEVETATAGVFDRADFCHQIMPANAGIRQPVAYGELDKGVAVHIDSFVDAQKIKSNLSDITRVTSGQVGTVSTAFAAGNAPIGYNITHQLSTAWEDVFANQKFCHALTIKTHWNNMYPVENGFQYGITTIPAGTHLVTKLSAGVVDVDGLLLDSAEAYVIRRELGFGEISYVNAAPVSIEGLTVGAMLMPNPWLPGTLMTVKDFASLVAAADKDDFVASQVAAQLGIAYPAGPTMAEAMTYGLMHRVGRCLKRQSRAYSDTNAVIGKQDIYAANYKYMVTVPGLGLSGSESDGIEADQEAARQFAMRRAAGISPTAGAETGVDVFFANLMII